MKWNMMPILEEFFLNPFLACNEQMFALMQIQEDLLAIIRQPQ